MTDSRWRDRMPVQMDVYGLAAGLQRMRADSFEWGTLAHVHTDIEINLVFEGELTLFVAGRFERVGAGTLCAFWAGMPHAVVSISDPTEYIWVSVPLAWFLQWSLPGAFRSRLLEGELLKQEHVDADRSREDELAFRRWVREHETGTTPADLFLLEVEARVRHMALGSSKRSARIGKDGSKIEQVARYVALHYQEPITVDEISEAVGLHPSYASQLFRHGCGMRLWEYVLRLRVSHAQRLLATGELNVLEVSVECGFSSQGRFYEAFRRFTGQSPGEYRDTLRGTLT